jgi:hypothetical protein
MRAISLCSFPCLAKSVACASFVATSTLESQWSDPWRREDDWGPITAAVMFFIILAGLIVYGSGAHL